MQRAVARPRMCELVQARQRAAITSGATNFIAGANRVCSVQRNPLQSCEEGKRSLMRITDVEVIPLRIPQHNVHIADGIQDDVIVRVHTDEGISGIGEADSSPLVVKAIVEAWPSWPRCRGLKDILVGEDPLNVEMLWEKMRFGTLWLGRNGVAQQAIAAVDIALWDLVGKATGKPVHSLLGAAYRDRVPVYASALFTEDPGEMTEVG